VPVVWFAQPLGCPNGGSPERVQAVSDYIREQTGVECHTHVLPPGSEGATKRNLLLASGTEEIDCFEGSWNDYKGMITPLDDLLGQYGPNILRMNLEKNWATMKDWEGTTWGYPRLGMMGHTYFPFVRSDYLDEMSMEVPKTWDELETYQEGVHEAHPDSYVVMDSRGNLMMNTLGAFTEYGRSNWVDDDGLLSPPELQPGYRDWVETMRRWWEAGWVFQESFTSADWRALLKAKQVGTWLGWYSRVTIWWGDKSGGIKRDLGGDDEPADFTFYDAMTGPKGHLVTVNAGSTSAYMIPRKSKHPEAVIKVMDWFYSGLPDDLDQVNTANLGLQGSDWEWVNKEELKYRSLVDADAACEAKYAGDFGMVKGMGTEPYTGKCLLELPDGSFHWKRQSEHVVSYWNNYDNEKIPMDYDVPYDRTAINDQYPNLGDMNRVLDEATIGFINGTRPLTDASWDAFMAELEAAGLPQWREAYTAQYRQYHPE